MSVALVRPEDRPVEIIEEAMPVVSGIDETRRKLMLEQFCVNFAFGKPLSECLRAAGYDVISVEFAYALLRSPEAMAKVTETRDWIAGNLAISMQHVLQQLDADREFAYTSGNPAAAVSATMNKAKIAGYLDPSKTPQQSMMVISWLNTP